VDEPVPFLLDARTLAAGDHFTFRSRAGDVHCLGTPAGVEGSTSSLGGRHARPRQRPVSVASVDDRSMKRAAGRPKDLAEVEVLAALRDETAS
jgi:hypothetical protein